MENIYMRDLNPQVPKAFLFIFRTIFYICAIFFFLMGIMMMIFPELVTKNAGVQHPLVLGLLRGSGGMIIGSTLFYILVAIKPFERGWAAIIIAFGNILAIILDFASVRLGEFQISHAMIDVPIELLSFLTIVIFYTILKIKHININSDHAKI
jgi:MFS family permease